MDHGRLRAEDLLGLAGIGIDGEEGGLSEDFSAIREIREVQPLLRLVSCSLWFV